MKLVSIALLVCAVAMASADDSPREFDLSKASEHFDKFVKDFNRNYKDEEDKNLHFEAFVKNLEKINELNKKNPTATFGINKFADYTEEETKQMRGLKKN